MVFQTSWFILEACVKQGKKCWDVQNGHTEGFFDRNRQDTLKIQLEAILYSLLQMSPMCINGTATREAI